MERLYLPRNKGGRGLASLEYIHRREVNNLKSYFLESKEKIICAISAMDNRYSALNLREPRQPDSKHYFNTLENKWKSKVLHGRYYASLHQDQVDKDGSVAFLVRGYLFPETEGSAIAIQDQVVPTKNYRKFILKENIDNSRCRLCNTTEETIQHLIAGCPSLAPTAYLSRHNNVAKIIHLELSKKYGLLSEARNYYNYDPGGFKENELSKLYWDFPLVTDTTIRHNRPDIVLFDKRSNTVHFIDVAVPLDDNIQRAHDEKMAKYAQLAIEIGKIWRTRAPVKILPIIISANGLVHKTVSQNISRLGLNISIIAQMQKAVILGTTAIVRRSLSR